MNIKDKAELLDWIAEQDRLRVETWHYMGGKTLASVWTMLDDDKPSGEAPTVIEALLMAKQHAEHEAAR